MNERLESAASALRARGYEASVFATAAEASEFILRDLKQAQTVAIGGCMTAKQMNLKAQLLEKGHTVLWHWEGDSLRDAMNAQAYICSANALTDSGMIVQIDGTGNRVAALCYGPSVAYLVVGRNKLVAGGYAQAVARIKQVACPLNARRIGLNTPCSKNDVCNPAACERPMCNVFLAMEHPPTSKRVHVLLIDEDLGY